MSGRVSRRSQRGVSLIIAVFILVVLSLLGAALINILSAGGESVAREVLSTRALFVAESGAQRKLGEVFPPGAATNAAACAASNYNWPGIEGCSSVSASVSCTPLPVPGSSTSYFRIVSTGRCGPSGSEAVRVIEIQARDGL